MHELVILNELDELVYCFYIAVNLLLLSAAGVDSNGSFKCGSMDFIKSFWSLLSMEGCQKNSGNQSC